jgi:hypothetical protein
MPAKACVNDGAGEGDRRGDESGVDPPRDDAVTLF